MERKSCKNSNKKYECDVCDYSTSRQSSINKHFLSRKHENNAFLNGLEQNIGISCDINSDINGETNNFYCKKCNKAYKARNSLWYHEQKCNLEPEPGSNPEIELKSLSSLVVELIKSNQDLQKQMLEVCRNSNSNNTINSNNKTFNLQLFLNEQCKDAMNIMEFVDTFQLQFSDLENVGKVGYVEGISDIIIKKLNEMDVYKRPIHCSDAKRDTLFVKDNNVWTKENGNHDKLRLAIRYITKKNTDMLNPWCESHPGSLNSENYLNDIYLNIVMQAMGGKGGAEENENKIIKKIAKMVLIDK